MACSALQILKRHWLYKFFHQREPRVVVVLQRGSRRVLVIDFVCFFVFDGVKYDLACWFFGGSRKAGVFP